jgi:penicillin-binding protein 1C
VKSGKGGKRALGWLVAAAALLLLYAAFRPRKPLLEGVPFSRCVYARDGSALRIGLASDERYRIFCPLERVSKELKQAVILKEDRWFYWHAGVNPVAVIRSLWLNYVAHSGSSGASTITMQLARLKYRLNTKTIGGKLVQMGLASYLSLYYPKREILEAYINLVPCGNNLEGFPAAARLYLDAEPEGLSLSQALLLAVLPQSPKLRGPLRADENPAVPADLLAARKRLFEAWVKVHPRDEDKRSDVSLPPRLGWYRSFLAPHFSQRLISLYPQESNLYGTLDPKIQRSLEDIVALYINKRRKEGILNCAVLVIDSETMETLGYLGSADFQDGVIEGQNDGAWARRSPGSALKPFIYGLAIEQGVVIPATLLKDSPTVYGEYTPENYGKNFFGPLSAEEALVNSRNIPALNLARLIKPDLYDLLKKAGIGGLKDRDHYGLSLTLGSAEVSLFELAGLYASLNNGGVLKPISTRKGAPPSSPTVRILSKESAWIVRDMLSKNPRPDAAPFWSAAPKSKAAYKTGTSIGYKDAWSIGIKGRCVIAVWVGNFNGTGNPAFLGREAATPLMFALFDALEVESPWLLRDKAETRPEGVSEIEVCEVSGQIPNADCPRVKKSLFIPGTSPIETCAIHQAAYIDKRSGFRTENRDPRVSRKIVFEAWPSDLLALFRAAGIYKAAPPLFPDYARNAAVKGQSPEIYSPQSNVVYIMRVADGPAASIPLKASAAADATLLSWYVDGEYLGSSKPEEIVDWRPSAGTHNLEAVDDKGRASMKKITIEQNL